MNRQFARRQRGNVLIEFALTFAVFVPLLIGAFQFGRAFYVYNKLHNAARAGARYASLRAYDSRDQTPSSAFLTGVQNTVLFGNPAGEGTPVVPGLTQENIVLTVHMVDAVPRTMSVSINNYSIDALFTKFALDGRPSVAFRYGGRFAP